MKMKLWILEPIYSEYHHEYDCALGFIIRAESEKEAKQYAQNQHGDESINTKYWIDYNLSSCKELTPDGNPGVIIVIMRDFNNG